MSRSSEFNSPNGSDVPSDSNGSGGSSEPGSSYEYDTISENDTGIGHEPSGKPFATLIQTRLYPHIRFVEDPEGLLAVDEHTLVISAYLHLSVPMMQTTAGLFYSRNGPAGFMVDRMDLDPEREMYSLGERASPRVVEILEGYERSDFDDHVLEREMYGEICEDAPYWLWNTELFLRRAEKRADSVLGE
ncbi:hypothetical protein BCR34DRAFT_612275 [Clohesyomyces aquaticus]|uniref:Uncharacterized protein n=1 Tax=Clohesyomyces aquaticus TaxID=1231657 RepID=A0A1Y1ZZY9_9PLEO|nr:hypothetical protein BCR34DRAFT_612275 [Clohesyomyces aquaticus]